MPKNYYYLDGVWMICSHRLKITKSNSDKKKSASIQSASHLLHKQELHSSVKQGPIFQTGFWISCFKQADKRESHLWKMSHWTHPLWLSLTNDSLWSTMKSPDSQKQTHRHSRHQTISLGFCTCFAVGMQIMTFVSSHHQHFCSS